MLGVKCWSVNMWSSWAMHSIFGKLIIVLLWWEFILWQSIYLFPYTPKKEKRQITIDRVYRCNGEPLFNKVTDWRFWERRQTITFTNSRINSSRKHIVHENVLRWVFPIPTKHTQAWSMPSSMLKLIPSQNTIL